MLSIIIPTLDEAKTLGKCVTSLQKQSGDFEILLVDGGSTDGTRKIAEKMGIRVIKSARGVAKQLEVGVAKAKGDVFLFLHADCMLAKNALSVLTQVVEEKNVQAGAFTLQYEYFDFLSAVHCFITNWNAKFFGRCSGEQGLFVTREALYAAGGIPQTATFETEKLCVNLKKAKKKVVVLDQKIIASNRRFLNGGLREFVKVNIGHIMSSIGFSDWHTKRFVGKMR